MRGYELVEVEKDIWFLQVDNEQPYYGTFKEVVRFAIIYHDFTLDEIESAVQNMLELNHNAANFGIYGGFIFSYKYSFDTRKAC